MTTQHILQHSLMFCIGQLVYHCMIKVKAAMDQFMEGLDMGGIADYVRTHLDLIRPLLQHMTHSINPGKYLHDCISTVVYYILLCLQRQ